MIYEIAECPYCRGNQEGFVGLEDDRIVFNPEDENDQPCPHLVLLQVRVTHWERLWGWVHHRRQERTLHDVRS